MKLATLNLQEAAELLGVPTSTVARWVRQGLLPTAPNLHHLAFDRRRLQQWARRHGFSVSDQREGVMTPPPDMLAEALSRGAFSASPNLETASDAIAMAVEQLPGLDQKAKTLLLGEVQARECLAPTALGNGVALPHPRRPPAELIDQPVASVVRSAQPLDWAALDGQAVDVIILVASPSVREHLEMLSRISRVLRIPEFVSTLREAESRDEVIAQLRTIRMLSQ